MILGLTLQVWIHVLISLAGIVAGFVVLFGMLTAQRMNGWTIAFLSTTLATSLTGIVLPAERFLPSHVFALLSFVLLGLAIYGLYGRRLEGRWRVIYVITALAAQYLNVFVLIVQGFQKVPPLHALAPTQSEPPFAVAQAAAFIAFLVLTTLAVRRFRPQPTPVLKPAV